jgi:hypothetical protein
MLQFECIRGSDRVSGPIVDKFYVQILYTVTH